MAQGGMFRGRVDLDFISGEDLIFLLGLHGAEIACFRTHSDDISIKYEFNIIFIHIFVFKIHILTGFSGGTSRG